MQANELRIGNLIYKRLKSGNGRTITGEVGCQDVVRIFEGIGSFIYEPILLSEDWLLKFGFKKSTAGEGGDNYVEYYEISNLVVCNWGDGFIMSNSFSHGIRVDLKYVHQLQNLFFAITGKELELSPVESA
jgi:hypothetical protein